MVFHSDNNDAFIPHRFAISCQSYIKCVSEKLEMIYSEQYQTQRHFIAYCSIKISPLTLYRQ